MRSAMTEAKDLACRGFERGDMDAYEAGLAAVRSILGRMTR
jgi:hypothetical protein